MRRSSPHACMIAENRNAARHRNTTGAAKPLAAFGNDGLACDSTSSIGNRMPLTPTGTASVIHTIATHETTASVALPSADRCAGAGSHQAIAKNASHAAAKPIAARQCARCDRPAACGSACRVAGDPADGGRLACVLSSGGVPIAFSVTGMLPVRRALGQQARSSIEMS